MNSQNDTDCTNTRSQDRTVPEHGQNPSDAESPPNSRENNDHGLNSKRSIFSRRVRPEDYAYWTLVATAALAAGTFVLAVATADMARSTRQLAHLAKDQAVDTKNAIAAANRQAAAAEMANRLFGSAQLSIVAFIPSQLNANSEFTISLRLFNNGKRPATHLKFQSKMYLIHKGAAQPGQLPICDACISSVLYATSGFQNNGLILSNGIAAKAINQALVDQIKNEEVFAFLIGRVDYDNENEHHTINSCYVYVYEINSTVSCASGNDFE